eukprot:TRINITY_DN8946_c0_g1_i2.p1 TRINITY_DN8946_c0_g1~~TRINITY_DN8946_c0_g1_i2.p1  ORF type:complete len:400 (-),score=95.96 TRINITY_DN8946_c0_g1_i2:8-1108(-)
MVSRAEEILLRYRNEMHGSRHATARLLDLHRACEANRSVDASNLQTHLDELNGDFAALKAKESELESINHSLRGLVDSLQLQAADLTEERDTLLKEQAVAQQQGRQRSNQELEQLRLFEERESQLRTQELQINRRIEECNAAAQRVYELTDRGNAAARQMDELDAHRLPLETAISTLSHAISVQNDQQHQLRHKIERAEEEARRFADAVLSVKKETAAAVLEIERRIQEASEKSEEMEAQLENEHELLGRHSSWAAAKLEDVLRQLVEARALRTDDTGDVHRQVLQLRDRNHRLEENLATVRRRNELLEVDLERLDEEERRLRNRWVWPDGEPERPPTQQQWNEPFSPFSPLIMERSQNFREHDLY